MKPPHSPYPLRQPSINESISRVAHAVARVCGVAPGSVISGEEWARRERAARPNATPLSVAIAWERCAPNQRAAEVSDGRLIITHSEARAVWVLFARVGDGDEASLRCELTREPTDAECLAWLAEARASRARIPSARLAVFGGGG